MEKTERKRPILNALKKVFGNPYVRGFIKLAPIGNTLYELAEKAKDKDSHSLKSLVIQLLGFIILFYAYYKGYLSLDQILKLINYDQVISTPAGVHEILTDTLSVN